LPENRTGKHKRNPNRRRLANAAIIPTLAEWFSTSDALAGD
jgi:hypothetical protein